MVTIDLAEADPAHRDEMRRRLGEPYRTLIGNLRHEIGHHYWQRLAGRGDHLDQFRALFGDERAGYAAALEHYYSTSSSDGWDEQRFVTRYARAHPYEDWAETFAHYLHIVDLVGTASAHGLGVRSGRRWAVEGFDGATVRSVLQQWEPIASAIDDMADAVGSSRPSPFHTAGPVVDKLELVHARVTALTDRSPFGSEPGDAHQLEQRRVR